MLKEISGFSHYKITENGEVWSDYSNKFLKPTLNNRGYLSVDLCEKGQRVHKTVHRLVAEAFIPNPNNLPMVHHKDENKTNNQVDNLEWCDAKYNRNYGENQRQTAIKRGKPVKCLETSQIYYGLREAGRQTGIDASRIGLVCQGKAKTAGGFHWQYVTN